MSQPESLAELFKTLGAEPNQLAAFQKNPNKFLDLLPKSEQDELLKISQQLTPGAPLINLQLADSRVAGGFYVGDDEGSHVYQLFTTGQEPTNPVDFSQSDQQLDSPQYDRIPIVDGDVSNGAQTFQLNGSSVPFTAVRQYEKPNIHETNTYHDATIQALNITIAQQYKGPLLGNVYICTSSSEGTINCYMAAQPEPLQATVSGDIDNEQTVDVPVGGKVFNFKTTKSSGILIIQTPGAYYKLQFPPTKVLNCP